VNLTEAVLLGVIQGIFEWLPVSSEAVIALVLTYLGKSPAASVNSAVFLHLGTAFAATVYFRSEYIEVLDTVRDYLSSGLSTEYSLTDFLAISTIVTGVTGFLGYVFLLQLVPDSPSVFTAIVGLFLLLTGLMQLYTGSESRKSEDSTRTDSLFTGLLQGISVVPGISRSGSTVFGLLYRGFDPEEAFRLSFLMSVPAVLGANVFLNIKGFNPTPELVLASGVSALVGYASIETVLRLAEKFEVAYICFFLAGLSFLAALI